jgi:hypothetical protein
MGVSPELDAAATHIFILIYLNNLSQYGTESEVRHGFAADPPSRPAPKTLVRA